MKKTMNLLLSVSVVLLVVSTALAFGVRDAATDSALSYLLNAAKSDYDRAVLLKAFEHRYSTVAMGLRLSLSKADQESLQALVENRCGTPITLAAFEIVARLGDPYAMSLLREGIFSKPAQLTKKVEDGTFEVWYTDNATAYPQDAVTEAYAQKVLDYMAKSYDTEIDSWGYKEGGTEDASNPGTQATKYQVYIHNLGGAYGETTDFVENPAGSTTTPQTFSAIGVAPSVTPDDLLLDTCAHEYHHASELAYMDASGFHLWILEASTTWIAYQVRLEYASVSGSGSWNLFKDRVEYHQDDPTRPLDLIGATVTDDYDAGIWMWFLANNRAIAGVSPDIILEFWEEMGELNDWSKIFDAFDDALFVLSWDYDSFDKIFPFFIAANYEVNKYYPKRIKTVTIENTASPYTLDYSTDTSHLVPETSATVGHLAAKYYKFVPGASLKKPSVLSIKVDGADNKALNAIAIVKNKDGTFAEYPLSLDGASNVGEVAISGFSSDKVSEVVLALLNVSKSEDGLQLKYQAHLRSGFTFVIDDTGSMGTEIAYARNAAIRVLDENKAKGAERFYTLISFKDGPGYLVGQSADEETMKGYISTLYAWGGAGCPESSLLSIRQAADLAEGSDILMITDASSNSYGVDDTYATWGELFQTIFKLAETHSRLHTIIYSDCWGWWSGGEKATRFANDEALQCPGCYVNRALFDLASTEHPDGIAGYSRASSESGGLYFQVTTGATEAAAEIILRVGMSEGTIAFFDGDGTKSYTVPVDSTVTHLQVTVNADPGSAVALQLKNPAGTAVNDATDGVSVIGAGGSTFYMIEAPALTSGVWTADVSGTGTYRFSADASTSNPMAHTGETALAVGGTLHMEASFKEPVSGLAFGLVRTDGSNPVAVTLTTTDGLTYRGTHVMNELGSYRLKATGSGAFMRMYPGKITVGSLDVIAPAPQQVTPGAAITRTFQIRNLGTEADTYDIFATSSEGWSDLSAVPGIMTLAPGEVQEIPIPVTVPADAVSGLMDELSVQAVSQTNSMINDTATTQTQVVTQVCAAATVSNSKIVDSTKPDADIFTIRELGGCTGLGDALSDLAAQTVYVKVGPSFSIDVPGNLFVLKPKNKRRPYYLYKKPKSKTNKRALNIKLYPGLERIWLGGNKVSLDGIGNPIAVKVELADRCWESTADWIVKPKKRSVTYLSD